MILETIDDLTKEQAEEFKEWFDKNIGTGIDIYPSASGDSREWYCLCSNINFRESVKVHKYLDSKSIDYY